MSRRFDFAAMMERARSRDTYWTECAIIEFTEELCRCMETQRITRADLARRLEVSPAFITKILRGNSNFTLETMTKLARAVGARLHPQLQPDGCHEIWSDRLAMMGKAQPAPVDLRDPTAGFRLVPPPTEEAPHDRFSATA